MTKTHIDHIGIIVADLDRAISMVKPLFGAPVRKKALANAGLRVAEFAAANVTIELLQYTGENDRFARRVMGERRGLNHISARVGDVRRSIAALRKKGFKLMNGFPRSGAHGKVAFFEPDPVTALLFEICEPDAEETVRRTPGRGAPTVNRGVRRAPARRR